MDPAPASTTLLCDVPLPVSRTLQEKLAAILLPEELKFASTSFHDALCYLRAEGYRLDVAEADEQRRGVSVWVGLHPAQPLILGEPGESKPLEHWLGRLRISACFPAGTSLGSVWQTVADVFELELRLHEDEQEGERLVLWLPGALPDAMRLDEESLLTLAFVVDMAKDLLRERGW